MGFRADDHRYAGPDVHSASLTGGPAIARALARDGVRQLSAGNLLEAWMLVQARYGDEGSRDLDLLAAKLGIQIAVFTSTQAEIARRAFREFGKGRHPAGLNFGDCIAYGLAKGAGEPLLFQGQDFSKTGIAIVRY
jgi:ribonuclease VapC